jgi:glycosyltransferase involved in cell wall biosynthesis
MDPLRILIVQETNWLDRNVIHQHHLGERLASRGHRVQVIDYDILWPERDHRSWFQPRQVFSKVNRVVAGASVDVIRPFTLQLPLLCHLTWALSSLWEVWQLMKRDRPDVVIGLTLTNSYPLALILKSNGIPYVDVVLEPYHTMMAQRWARYPARLMERLALKAADQVVVFTPQMSQYVQAMGAEPDKMVTLKTGVSLDLFHPSRDGLQARASLGIRADDWVLFFMGWLYDFSGLRQILTHVSQHPDFLDGSKFLIVGDGDLYPELKDLVGENGLSTQLILTGRRPYAEVPDLLAAADVCLLPSIENDTTRDIVPMKVYEYLAAGKPVVASRLPGLQAEFGHDNGILYAGDPLKVVEKAIGLAKSPAQLQRMGVVGRRCAENNADWDKTAQIFEHLLQSVSDGKPEAAECSMPI